MTRDGLLDFLRRHRLAVVSTVSVDGAPEAAVVGIAISDELEIISDTLGSSRKARNLRLNPKIALLIGWDEETVQIEGLADEPARSERERCKRTYFQIFSDGRDREKWPEITYFRVRPSWARYSDFKDGSQQIVEFDL